jgi:hypothetical protein
MNSVINRIIIIDVIKDETIVDTQRTVSTYGIQLIATVGCRLGVEVILH